MDKYIFDFWNTCACVIFILYIFFNPNSISTYWFFSISSYLFTCSLASSRRTYGTCKHSHHQHYHYNKLGTDCLSTDFVPFSSTFPISLHLGCLGRPSAFLFNLPLASCRTRHHHHYNNLCVASNPIHNNVKTSKCLMTSK